MRGNMGWTRAARFGWGGSVYSMGGVGVGEHGMGAVHLGAIQAWQVALSEVLATQERKLF